MRVFLFWWDALLLTIPFYFLWSAVVIIVISLMTEKPPLEKTENLTFTLEEFRRETKLPREGS